MLIKPGWLLGAAMEMLATWVLACPAWLPCGACLPACDPPLGLHHTMVCCGFCPTCLLAAQLRVLLCGGIQAAARCPTAAIHHVPVSWRGGLWDFAETGENLPLRSVALQGWLWMALERGRNVHGSSQ